MTHLVVNKLCCEIHFIDCIKELPNNLFVCLHYIILDNIINLIVLHLIPDDSIQSIFALCKYDQTLKLVLK